VSTCDVSPDEMKRFDDMSDNDVEHLLAGSAPDAKTGLDDIARFFASVARAYPEPSTEAYERTHVDAMLETVRATAASRANDGEMVGVTAGRARAGVPRGLAFRGLLARPGARAAGIALAVLLVFGSTAYAGILPAPLQAVVAQAARAVGITLPDPTARPSGNPHRASEGNTGLPNSAAAGPSAQGGSNTSASAGAQPGSSSTTGAADANKGRGKVAHGSQSSAAKSKGSSKAHRASGRGPHGAGGSPTPPRAAAPTPPAAAVRMAPATIRTATMPTSRRYSRVSRAWRRRTTVADSHLGSASATADAILREAVSSAPIPAFS